MKSQSEFTEENSNGTVLTDYIYSNFYISNNIICDNHSQENKKTLADIVFVRTNSAAYIHRTDDLLLNWGLPLISIAGYYAIRKKS